MFFKKLMAVFCCLLWGIECFAAVGCDLNDPDRDVKRFFPQSSGYKSDYKSVLKEGGDPLYQQMQEALGDSFSGIFEKIDVPYTLYTILNGEEVIGYIHGVNQKGKYGGMQVFLILDTNGVIQNFYFQKLTSKDAKELRSEAFSKQFVGLTMNDFMDYNVKTHEIKDGSPLNNIKNMALNSPEDFYAALRGVKKNLILMDNFIFHKNKQD